MAPALLEAARKASSKAYCRYSGFPVGAAVLVPGGQRFEAVNVENASYGLTVCAERNAIFRAVAAGFTTIDKIAVSCPKGDPANPLSLMPCGACLQVMAEFMSLDAEVIVDRVGVFILRDLLPRPFHL